jgi:hypothetical protein
MEDRSGGKTDAKKQHKDWEKANMTTDEKDAQALLTHIQDSFLNPFSLETVPNGLVNISTGKQAPPEIEKQLLSALEVGEEKLKKNYSMCGWRRVNPLPLTSQFRALT